MATAYHSPHVSVDLDLNLNLNRTLDLVVDSRATSPQLPRNAG
jgi:hypothetical protein